MTPNGLGKETLRVAVIGIGKMGLLHACILNVLPGAKLVALCDKNAMIRRISERIFKDVQVTDDVEKLTGLGLDAAYITTPIPSHFLVVKTMYSKGITRNLFVEKTLASNYAEAKELCELAQNSKSINMVGYMKRFAVTFRKAKALLDQETLGDLLSFDAYAYSSDFSEAKKNSKNPRFHRRCRRRSRFTCC